MCQTCFSVNEEMNDRLNQGHIEPPMAARGNAMYIDGKMLIVTKYSYLSNAFPVHVL